ncbi:FG-GAP repeat protein [Streptomyces sp. RKCA744]|uniref:FG-GAP repeat protein n=1 Tax=Streptomyces sp. RKCA744 TaxID=2959340 RepID=UPI00209CD51F|nr:FG-GAP repeat protein [Streptomyces sp. RKCA744]
MPGGPCPAGRAARAVPQDVTVAGATEVATADLDGDGCADVITTAGEALGKRETERTQATVRTVPYISWGGPGGPRQTRAATRVELTGPKEPHPTSRTARARSREPRPTSQTP